MFTHSLDTYAELRLLEPRFATELYALVDKNRARLRLTLPWVDSTRSAADTLAFVRHSLEGFAAGRSVNAGIWLGGKLVGVIGLAIDGDSPVAELGYWLGQDYEGKGLVTRASRAMLQHAFLGLGLDRVAIRVAVGNDRGHAIAARLGFVNEGTARHGVWVNGVPTDITTYSMLAKEWRG